MKNIDSLRKRYEQVRDIVENPFRGNYRVHLFGDKYTGTAPIGSASVDNTENQAKELAFALSLSKHPMIYQLVSDSKFKTLVREARYNSDMQPELDALADNLAENKVLEGLKILDLGCGQRPTFASCARALGADRVYTADIIPSNKLWVPKESREAIDNHIQLDLRVADAYDTLKNRTKGNFDLVASATIHEMAAFADAAGRAAPPNYLEDLALALAKEDGVYFNAEYLEDEEIRVKDPAVNYEERVRNSIKKD